MSRYFITPDSVSAFGFDWGQLALTVGPSVNGAERFSGGIVTVAPGKGGLGPCSLVLRWLVCLSW